MLKRRRSEGEIKRLRRDIEELVCWIDSRVSTLRMEMADSDNEWRSSLESGIYELRTVKSRIQKILENGPYLEFLEEAPKEE
jgi:hypothetical protein